MPPLDDAPTAAEYQQMAAAVGRLLMRLDFENNQLEHDAGHWALHWLNSQGAMLVAREARER